MEKFEINDRTFDSNTNKVEAITWKINKASNLSLNLSLKGAKIVRLIVRTHTEAAPES